MTQLKENISEDIDGYRYRVFMMDPLSASDMVADIGAIVGPAIAALASSSGGLDGVMDNANPESIQIAANQFFSKLTKEKQRDVISKMTKLSVVIGSDGTEQKMSECFNIHFTGRLKFMYKWLLYALKVQFGDFIGGLTSDMSRSTKNQADVSKL